MNESMGTGTPIAQPPAALPVSDRRVRVVRRVFTAAGAVLALVAVLFTLRGLEKAKPAPEPMQGMAEMGSESTPPLPNGASSSAVLISPARQQLIGVRTGTVAREHLDATTRTVGVLAYDETRTTHIHVKVAGWVEQLFVDFVGKPIRRGQPLFSVYSPDLVTAESDYLIALRTRQQLAGASLPSASSASDALVNAARERLRRWDVTDAEIAALEANGKPAKTVTLVAPFDGVVLERNTFAGQYITPDMDTFKIADLSTIWAVGQAFELDASRVRRGAPIEIEFPNDRTAQPIHATIDFVFPDVDPQTRRLRFRANLPNPGQRLKPDTYVTIVLHGEAVDRLVVPREAVIDTGARKYVLVALADGYFDPRDVEVGPSQGDVYPVVSGVKEGDRVVTSAQFLVDSETNLMSAMQNMSMTMPGMDMGAKKPAPPEPKATMPAMSGMTPSVQHPSATPSHADHPPASATAPMDMTMPMNMPMPMPSPALSSAPPKRPDPPAMSNMPGM